MKTLIISHNAITTFDAMGKVLMLYFGSFAPNELCQFYIYPTTPDCHVCNSYYRVTDKDVLKRFVGAKGNARVISPSEINVDAKALFENRKDEALYRSPKNHTPLRRMARDLLWRRSSWLTPDLEAWLERERPDNIVVAPGSAKFLLEISLTLARKLNVPTTVYICDEFYFTIPAKSVPAKLERFLLRKKYERLLERADGIVTICKEAEELYSRRFGKRTRTIMAASDFEIASESRDKKSDVPRSIVYMGNVRCGRYKSLAQIGRVLAKINEEKHENFHLDVYTGEHNQEILNVLKNESTIRVHSFVTGDEFKRVFFDARILLHIESFEEKYVEMVKHSVSTKIATILASGICLFAYGPGNVASMRHLTRNDCAITVVNPEDLKEALLKVFYDGKERERVVVNALECAREYHSREKIADDFRRFLEETLQEPSRICF